MFVTPADVLLTLAAPAFTALLVAWLVAHLLPAEVASRWKLAAAVAAGFAAGYVLLPEWAPLWPDRHWMWLPWLAIIAAILGSLSVAERIRPWERWLAFAALAGIAAQAIVPTWDTLQPSRPVLLPLVAGYLFLLTALLSSLPGRLQGGAFTALLALATFGTAALVGYEVSVKFGQLGATLAAALIGAAGVVAMTRKRDDSDHVDSFKIAGVPLSNRGLALLYSISAGGLALVGAIEPAEPAWPILLAPAAPLTLWLFARPPLSRLSRASQVALQIIAVLLILAAAVGWLLLGGASETDEWSAARSASVFTSPASADTQTRSHLFPCC